MAEEKTWPWTAPDPLPGAEELQRETFEREVVYVCHLPAPGASEEILYIDRNEKILTIDDHLINDTEEIPYPREFTLKPGDDVIVLVLKGVRK
jgi:hypothetical protein